jgi:hypothetical protein
MKTTDWDRLDPAMQHSALLYYQALLSLEQKQAMEAAIQQQQMAEQLGMGNASKPQGPPDAPEQRKPDNQGPQGAQGQQPQ